MYTIEAECYTRVHAFLFIRTKLEGGGGLPERLKDIMYNLWLLLYRSLVSYFFLKKFYFLTRYELNDPLTHTALYIYSMVNI